jgi:hypothetical protein
VLTTIGIVAGLPVLASGAVLLSRWSFRRGFRAALADLCDPHNPRAARHLEKINRIRMRRKSWVNRGRRH